MTGRPPVSARLRLFAALLLPLALAGCMRASASPGQITLPQEVYSSLARYQRVYVLGPGDQLEVAVDNVPEWNRSGLIRPDGMFTMPRLGDIALGGLSVPEAKARIAGLLSQRLRDPQITLSVQNPRDDVVLVAGDVGRAGPVPVRQAQTVAAALLAAGGPLRTGSVTHVALIRLDDEGHLVARVLRPVSGGQAGALMSLAAVPVHGGDIVFVPENGRSQLTRFIQDIINTPLVGVNQLFTPYIQFRLLQKI